MRVQISEQRGKPGEAKASNAKFNEFFGAWLSVENLPTVRRISASSQAH
jgi:hypothetical protein